MEPPFDTTPVRPPARRGRTSAGVKGRFVLAHRVSRDEDDIAIVAARMLTIAGRLQSRMRRSASAAQVESDVVALLLVFADLSGALRIVDIADLLGVNKATASRLATKAEVAGLIDKFTTEMDHREVRCRLSAAGDAALSVILEWLRPHATEVFRPDDGEWATSARALLERSKKLDPRGYETGWRAATRLGDQCSDYWR
jgi:DNA-binding MarR family transcriptional regulator